jgi:hypothetical protein
MNATEAEVDTKALLPWPGYDKRRWSEQHIRHGHTSRMGGRKDSPTYVSWQAMRTRCNRPDRDPDSKYAGRGISYDPAWDSFDQFLADMGERPEGTTLERMDNAAGYSASNCCWATPVEQARNRRNARLTFDQAVEVAVRRLRGETRPSLAKAFGISESLPREIVKGRTWKDALAKAQEIVNG